MLCCGESLCPHQTKILNLLKLRESVAALVVVRLEDTWEKGTNSIAWLNSTLLSGLDLPWRTNVTQGELQAAAGKDSREWYKGKRASFTANLNARRNCSIYMNPESLKLRLNREMVRSVNALMDPVVEDLLGYHMIKVHNKPTQDLATSIQGIIILLAADVAAKAYVHV